METKEKIKVYIDIQDGKTSRPGDRASRAEKFDRRG